VEPKVEAETATVPFVGFKSAPQSTMGHDGADPLQAPLAWHVRVATPDSW
jgi:hypothetical protein